MRHNVIFWSQRAKMQWLRKGDQNTKFFHNVVKIRQHRNKVTSIKDNSCNTFTNQTDIEGCFLNFYQKLWSSSSHLSVDSIFNDMLDDFATLTDVYWVELIKPLSKKEVFQTLKSMSHGKIPGLDGLTLEFFIFYWNIIRDHFFKGISQFFSLPNFPLLGVRLLMFLF